MEASTLVPPGQPGPMAPGEYNPAASPNLVTFNTSKVAPPSPLYIQRDDLLTVLMIGSATGGSITVTGRILEPADGVIHIFQQSFVYSNAAYTTQQFQVQLTEGWLLGFSIVSGNANFRGQQFARAFLSRGSTSVPLNAANQGLVGDYVTKTQALSWPGGRLLQGTEGPGNYQSIGVTSPGAGADFTYTLPTGNLSWRIAAIKALLTTSAAVANRFVKFSISGFTVGCTTAQVASQAITWTCLNGAPSAIVGTLAGSIPLPNDFRGRAAGTIGSVTEGLQAGDQWSVINVTYEEWLDV